MISKYPVDLEAMEIIEVYVYYDRPLLFSCRDRLGHIYLAVLVEEEDDFETWLYVEVSERRFQFIRTGGIDLHDAFSLPESGYAIVVTINNEDEFPCVDVIHRKEVRDDWLPKRGEYLQVTGSLEKEAITIEAKQILREVIDLRLEFPNLYRHEAPAQTLGEILSSFQAAMNQIGLTLHQKLVPLLVVGTGPGSFKLELQSVDQVNLFGETQAGDVIKEFIDLINLSDNLDQLKERLQLIEAPAAEKVLKFLKSISGDVENVFIDWASPRPNYGGSAHLTPLQVQNFIATIELQEISSLRVYQVKGRLRAINLDTKYYALVTESGEKFSDYFSDEAIKSETVQTAQVNKEYIVTIEEKTELKAAIGKTTVSHTIIHLDNVISS